MWSQRDQDIKMKFLGVARKEGASAPDGSHRQGSGSVDQYDDRAGWPRVGLKLTSGNSTDGRLTSTTTPIR